MRVSFYIKAWWLGLADDLMHEERLELENINSQLSKPETFVSYTLDRFGQKTKVSKSAEDYLHIKWDSNGNVIDSDLHKQIKARYAGRIFNRYMSLIIGGFGSIIGLVGGILGLLSFCFVR
jgi:hypothetical protein